MKSKCWLLLLFLSGLVTFTNAQTPPPEMADVFRADGKIYVVIAVMALVFISLVILLLIIERRLKKLENKFNK